jgi:PadR family transcriptional regulator, regulatory protein PadR
MSAEKSEVLQGTLDLMAPKTVHALGPQHGFGIARHLEQINERVLKVICRVLRLEAQK